MKKPNEKCFTCKSLKIYYSITYFGPVEKTPIDKYECKKRETIYINHYGHTVPTCKYDSFKFNPIDLYEENIK